MKEVTPQASPRRLPIALAIAGLVVAAAALGLYAARRTVARDLLTAWLHSKGVPAVEEVQAIGPTGVAGRLSIGDPRRPDFTAERVEVGYGLRGLSFEVRSVRLVRPMLRARLHEGRLSAGALDPLIEEFRKGPPRPNAAQPRIVIDDGVLQLETDYGPLQIAADGSVAQGRLTTLAARVAPARLKGAGFDLNLASAALSVQTAGGRSELSVDAPIASVTAGRFVATNARLRVTAAGPYPDLKRRREPGAVVAHAELSGGRLALGGQALRNGLLSAALTGQVSGWVDDLTLVGRGVADLRAGAAETAGGAADTLRASASAEDLRWTRKGGDKVQAQIAASASLDRFVRGDMTIAKATAAARGPVALTPRGAEFQLIGHALGHGAWTGLGAPGKGDSAEIAAAKRAARGFRFAVPAVALRGSAGGLSARLVEPARLLPDGGGVVTLAPAGAGWRLAVAGGGLPKVDADIRRFALAPGSAAASGRIKAALSIGPVQDGVFDAAGDLRLAKGAVSFSGRGCAQVSASRLEFGNNDVERFTGRLCPAGRPLLGLGGGDWRIAGRAQDVSAEVPFLQTRLAAAAGAVDLGSAKGALQARMSLQARASDTAAQTRFRPVGVSGEAQLARGLWTGELRVRDGGGRPLARAGLKHEVESGRGRLDIETGALQFVEGGLQPAELSPLAAMIGAPAQGEARFTGGFAWTLAGATSSGVLEVPHIDFQSPAGRVSGLSGRVVFSSLAPLEAAPGQRLQAVSVATPIAPLADVRLSFELKRDALKVTTGQAAVGGGLARIGNLRVPLAPSQPIGGVLDLEGVQLHDLIEASPFGDRVELDAKVSGSVPFTAQGEKVRVSGGALHAIQPGRLSIQRTALTSVAASGSATASGAPGVAVPAPSTDTISDFAYQAMENLAFSTLEARVDSRPDGRLAVLFHIVGKHDPPQHQEIRLSFMDVVRKRFLGRKLPLPSGTGVDLTLDTTLNLDDLLADYAEFRRLHGSATVQP